MPSLEMNQGCIYCGRVLPVERLSQRKDGWVCADTEECLEFQETNSVGDSTHPSEEATINHAGKKDGVPAWPAILLIGGVLLFIAMVATP